MSDIAQVETQVQQQAPPQQAPSQDSGAMLRAAMEAQIQHDRGNVPKQQEKAPEQQQSDTSTRSNQSAADAEVARQEAAANQQEAAPKDGPQKPWDKLGKPPEEAKPQHQNGEEFPDQAPKEQNAWTNIKRRVKEYEAKEQQWQKQQQEWEAKVKEYESRSSEFKPEVFEKLKKYEERYAIDYVQETEDYQKLAAKPYQEGMGVLGEVAEFTGITINQIQNALLERNSILRDEKVLALLDTSTKEMSDARKAALQKAVMEAGDKLNAASYEHARMMQEAGSRKEQREMAEKASQMKAKEEATKVFRTALSEISQGMKGQMQDLIESGIFKADDFEFGNVNLTDDVMDRGFGEVVAQLYPKTIKALRSTQQKLAEAEATIKEMRGAQPGVKPGSGSRTNGDRQPSMTLQQAMAASLSRRGLG